MKRFELLLLGAVTAIAGCGRSSERAAKPTKPVPRLTIVTDRPSLDELANLPPDQARRVRLDIFRLRPDRRFLIALGELERLVRGDSAVRLRLSWSADAWRIESRQGRVATAPEVSRYGELRRILTARARTLLSGSRPSKAAGPGRPDLSALQKACDGFESAKLIDSLRKLGDGWTPASLPDGDAAALGAHAFVLLTVQSLDTLEMADLLRGKALALLALAEAMGRTPDPADEALLACSLDYAADAARAATALPEKDPVRLYVTGQTEIVVQAAEREGSSRLTRYLALLSLASKGDPLPWTAFEKKQFGSEGFSLPVLRAASLLHSFEMNVSLGNATLFATLAALPGSRPSTEEREPARSQPPDWSEALVRQFVEAIRRQLRLEQAALVRSFESALGHECGAPAGTLWDSDTCRSWYRGFFYSGLYALGHRHLDELADVEGTRQLAAYLQGSPEGPGAQFARWYADMSAVLSGQPPGDSQFEDLSKLTWLGHPAVERTATVLIDRYQPGHDASADIGSLVAQRLDGRPAHLDYMTRIAADPLLDFSMVERLCRAWLDLGAKAEYNRAVRCLSFLASTKELEALISRRDLDMPARADALTLYCYLPYSSNALCRAQFRALAEECGYERVVTGPWADYADKRKDYAESQRVAEGWLAHHGQSAGLMWYVYRGRLAHSLSMQGRHREAWKIIEPALESGQGAVMLWASEILERLGRNEEALDLARRAIERYPDGAEQRAVLAEILWRANRDSEAALVLDPPEPGYKVDEAVWRDDLSQRFADVFRERPDGRVESALTFLKGQEIWDRKLSYLIPPLAAAGRDELAFRLVTSLSHLHRHWWDITGFDKDAFGYLEKARGRSEAAAWLQKAIPSVQRESALEAFFDKRAYALLWDAVPAAEEPEQSEWVWLLRSGAAVADPTVAVAHRGSLLEHFRDPMPREPTRILARYLLRLEDREAVVRAMATPVDRCKAEYFFGLEEIAAGRYEEASDWYQLTFDGCTKTWAWRLTSFARTTLARWYTVGQNLREAEARRIW